MYVWESVHKQEVSFAETYFILAVCEDLRNRQVRLKRDVIKFFPVFFLLKLDRNFSGLAPFL